jgi:hypothetical protein
VKSLTLPSFWTAYAKLDAKSKRAARKAFRLWAANPFHPSLHFKCINRPEDIWSVRITQNIRAVGVLEKDEVTWFWIGSHAEYDRFIG